MNIPYISKKLAKIRQKRYRNIDNYLSLMEKCLTGTIYEDAPLQTLGQKKYDPQLREYGWDWPSSAHTMIGSKRLHNVRMLLERCIALNIPGDFIETGVWRGGACIMAKAVLKAHAVEDRKVWLADSFEGLPAPNPTLYPADDGDKFHTFQELAVDLETVRSNFKKYDLLDSNVHFLKGWFADTLPNSSVDSLAVLRLDGDMYESTMDALNALYPKLSVGGYVIVDDYHVVAGCKSAVHDYLDRHSIKPTLEEIDGVGIFWQKC
jgi:O-methyltransferase